MISLIILNPKFKTTSVVAFLNSAGLVWIRPKVPKLPNEVNKLTVSFINESKEKKSEKVSR